MRLRKRVLVLFLLMLVRGASLPGQIEIPQGKWWRNDPGLVQALNLTPQQINQIDHIFERYREPLLDLQLDFRKRSLDLQRMLEADPLDERRIESQVTLVEQSRSELAKQRLMMIVKIRGQLLSEQWRRLRETYEQRQPMRPARPLAPRGPGRRRPPGD